MQQSTDTSLQCKQKLLSSVRLSAEFTKIQISTKCGWEDDLSNCVPDGFINLLHLVDSSDLVSKGRMHRWSHEVPAGDRHMAIRNVLARNLIMDHLCSNHYMISIDLIICSYASCVFHISDWCSHTFMYAFIDFEWCHIYMILSWGCFTSPGPPISRPPASPSMTLLTNCS